MLTQPTMDKLEALRLSGMVKALVEQREMAEIDSLGFEERLGLLVDRELTERENRRLRTRLKRARLRQAAVLEDLDYRAPRGLDKGLMASLASGRWIVEHLNVLITGPTGVGKSWVACALAHQACRQGHRVIYQRVPRLFQDLALGRADGRYGKLMLQLARCDLLVLDDWGLATFTQEQRHDVLEILEDRHGVRSTLVTSQVPVEQWHELIGEPTLADAILDRLVHTAYRIKLKGESMRKQKTPLTGKAQEK